MAFQAHANLAYTTVLTPPSPAASGSALTVQAGEGALFPAAPFNIVICPADTLPLWTNSEIATVTDKGGGDDWTITRTAESTSGARTILAGDQVFAPFTKKHIEDIEAGTNFPALAATGDLTIGGSSILGAEVRRGIDTSYLRLSGGNGAGVGANVALFGSTAGSGNANKGQLNASAGWTVTGTFTLTSNPATYGLIFDGTNGGGIAATHASGALRFYTGGTSEVGRIENTGQVFLGETIGIVYNTRLGLAFSGSGNFGCGIEIVNTNNTSNAVFEAYVANGVECGTVKRIGTTAAVNFNTSSDKRLKRNFRNFGDEALDLVLRIDAGTYEDLASGQPLAGVIAQQVHPVYPYPVTPGAKSSDMWSVDYGKFTPLLIGAMKVMAARVRALEARV